MTTDFEHTLDTGHRDYTLTLDGTRRLQSARCATCAEPVTLGRPQDQAPALSSLATCIHRTISNAAAAGRRLMRGQIYGRWSDVYSRQQVDAAIDELERAGLVGVSLSPTQINTADAPRARRS